MGPRGSGPGSELLQFRREVEAVQFVVHELTYVPREVVVSGGRREREERMKVKKEYNQCL